MADTMTQPLIAETASTQAGSTFTPVNKIEVKVDPDTTPEAEMGTTTAETPAAPSKNKPSPKKVSTPKIKNELTTPKKPSAKRSSDSNTEETPKCTKRAKSTPTTDRKGIPTRIEDLTEEDKMLLKWRDEGKSWADVKAEWHRIVGGQMPGGSTLPNRLARIKAAIFVVPEADIEQLKLSVIDVEAAIEAEYKEALAKKWTRVAAHMKENGVSEIYTAAALEKHYKKWQASQKSTTPELVESGVEADGEETTG